MADDDAHRDEQDGDGDNEEFVERTVLVNPNVIENYWQKGKKPLCYFKRWRHLRLQVTDYEFIRTYYSLTRDKALDLADTIDEAREYQGLEPAGEDDEKIEELRKRREFCQLAKRARENFDDLSEEEQSEFRWAHLKDIQPAQQPRELRLDGWAEIESGRSIELFSVGTKEKTDERKYSHTFYDMQIIIHGDKGLPVGHLIHWTEDLRRYDRNDPGRDYLVAELQMKEERLTELEQEVRQRGGKVPLEILIEAHLFQYEVEAGLAEPYHSQTYNMIYDTDCSIILSSISIGAQPKSETDDDDLDSYLDDEEREEEPDLDAKFKEGILSAVFDLGTSLGHIKIALWLLAIFFLLSLVV